MKLLSNILFFSIFFIYSVNSQDVGISGSYTPTSIQLNTTSNLKVIWSSFPSVPYPIGEVYIQVNVPKSNYTVIGSPTGSFLSTYFGAAFNDDNNDGVWFGYNTVPIPTTVTEAEINFTVQGDVLIMSNLITLLETNFASLEDGETGDNEGKAGLIVTQVMPIELFSFDANNSKCGEMKLEWETASERNNDYMEVLRSMDGNDFIALGRVKGTNSDSRSPQVYSFTDNFGLTDGQKYYYRLKQVDFDGRSELFKIISAENTCPEKKLSLSLFPNPSIDKISLTLEGFKEAQEVTIRILNNEGVLVCTKKVSTALINEVLIDDLSPGIYQIQGIGTDQDLSARFIKIK